MALTDVQIYAAHPDIKALNDEWVALGKSLPDLANAVTTTGAALTEAQEAQRKAVQESTEAVQAAQKQLAIVKAAEALTVSKAESAYQEAESQARRATDRRSELQKRHNTAMEAVQAAHAAEEAQVTE